LSSLTGVDALPSEGEVRAYYTEQKNRSWSLCIIDHKAPWRIQRKQGATAVELFPWEDYWRIRQVEWESDWNDAAEDEHLEPRSLLDEQAVRAEWEKWRLNLTKRYNLESLTPPTLATETTPQFG
jgi:hypothetical protein